MLVWRLRRQRWLTKTAAHMIVMAAVFAAIGLTLWLQPHRYDNTPAYANLLEIARQRTWAAVYLAAAALKIAAIVRRGRTLFVITHTVSITLVSIWLGAFVLRYLTDSGTTVVNVCSWSVYLYLVVRSALEADDRPVSMLPQDTSPQDQDDVR